MTDEVKKPEPIPDMGEDKLREFILGVCDCKIFTSAQIKKNVEPYMVFLVLAFMEGPLPENVGIAWEWWDQALPRSINGHPIFTSCRLMNKANWERCRAAIDAELERRKTIPL